jgi:transposase
MGFVAIKSVGQQAILAWHRVRQGWQEEGTALLNRTRGLLAEFGVVIARSADRFLSALLQLIDDARLPDPVRSMLLEVG